MYGVSLIPSAQINKQNSGGKPKRGSIVLDANTPLIFVSNEDDDELSSIPGVSQPNQNVSFTYKSDNLCNSQIYDGNSLEKMMDNLTDCGVGANGGGLKDSQRDVSNYKTDDFYSMGNTSSNQQLSLTDN